MNALKALLQVQLRKRSAVGDKALMGENRWAFGIVEAAWHDLVFTLPWRGRVVSHRAKQDASRGGVKVCPFEQCSSGKITPPRSHFAALT